MQTSINKQNVVVLEEDATFNVTEEALYFLDSGKIWRITPDQILNTSVRFFTVSGVLTHPETGMQCPLGSSFFVKKSAEEFKERLVALGAQDILYRYMDVPLTQVAFLTP